MTIPLWLANLTAYSLQVAALVGAAALVVTALRLRPPRVRLAIWQALLVACLALPLIQPWRPAPAPRADAIVTTQVAASLSADAIGKASAARRFAFPPILAVAAVLAAGALLRLAWLGLGFLRLARYRRDMTALDPLPPGLADVGARVGARASIGVVAGLRGPVTFGWRRPLVLLPPAVLALDPSLQQSVVCHELLHVLRRDWIWSVVEELVCAVAWFHPAIWWLVAQIDLAREQHVDAEVVRLTGRRKPYLEALLYLAGPDHGADLVPASALLRRRHLAKRLLVLAREASMSRPRIVLSVAVVIALLSLTAGAAAVSFPLVGTPRADPLAATPLAQAPVRVGGDIKPPKKIVDVRPVYPPEAHDAGVQGVVILEILIAEDGTVADAKVMRSIPLLNQAALDAVRQWVFAPTVVDGTAVPVIMIVTVNFTLTRGDKSGEGGVTPQPQAPVRVGGDIKPPKKIVDVRPVYPPEAHGAGVQGVVILEVTIGADGHVEEAQVLRSIPLLNQAALDAVRQWVFAPTVVDGTAVPAIMIVTVNFTLTRGDKSGEGGVKGGVAGGVPGGVGGGVKGGVAGDVKGGVGGGVAGGVVGGAVGGTKAKAEDAQKPQAPARVYYVAPVYPDDARAQKVEGIVTLEVRIGTDGLAADVKALRGHELLTKAAIDAVRKWRWDPPAVPMVATVTVRFKLDEQADVTARPNLGDQTLEVVHEVKPPYPPDAREAKLVGDVAVEVVVDENGRVASARVLKGADAFHQAALDAVRQWEFKPTGKRVKTTVEFTFNLK